MELEQPPYKLKLNVLHAQDCWNFESKKQDGLSKKYVKNMASSTK